MREGIVLVGRFVVCRIRFAEEPRHQQSNAHAEDDGEHHARQRDIHPDSDAGQRDGEDIHRWPHEEERDRRADARALLIDTGKEWHDGAGADCQHESADGRGRVGDPFGVLRPRYLVMASFGTSAANAPAMRNAGNRHSSTCAARYAARLPNPV